MISLSTSDASPGANADISSVQIINHEEEEEEVSLSNSSLGSDSSDDDEEDEEEASALTSSSFGGGDERISISSSGHLMPRHTNRLHLPPRPKQHQNRRLDSATSHAIGDLEFDEATILDQKVPVPVEAIQSTLTAEVLHQHALFSQACLELLEERDRYELCRRQNLRSSLNCITKTDDDEEEDDTYPLLSLIKSGPLYKLHLKGGKTTQKIKSGRDRIKSKLTRSSSGNSVASSGESSMLTKWKHKYVEVRKGMLSYYANTTSSLTSKSDLVRKNITLETSTSCCRAITLDDTFETGGTISSSMSSSLPPKGGKKKELRLHAFELVVNGEARIFASNSEAGRKAWIQCINRGMIGTSAKKDMYKKDHKAEQQLQEFVALSEKVKSASISGQQLAALWGTSVIVPFESLFADGSIYCDKSLVPPPTTLPVEGLDSFWRNLESLDIEMNGNLFRWSSLYCPQRVFGELTRSIRSISTVLGKQDKAIQISDIQASKHARDILRAVGRHDDKMRRLKASVCALCNVGNEATAIEDVEDESQLVKISVDRPQLLSMQSAMQTPVSVDIREWVYVRRKQSKQTKRYFAVLSVGVLCFYKEELPRPHRLRGQLLLVDAGLGMQQNESIELSSHTNEDASSHSSGFPSSNNPDTQVASSAKRRFSLHIKGREGGKWIEQELCFVKHETFIMWRDALIGAIKSCSSSSNVLSFDGIQPQSQGEVQSVSNEEGIVWMTTAAGDLHFSQLSGVRRASRFLGSLPPLHIPSPKFASNSERKYSYPTSLLSSAASVASKRLSRKMRQRKGSSNDVLLSHNFAADAQEEPSRSAASIEVKTSKLYRVFLKGDAESSTCTVRSTHTEIFACSGGNKGRLEKKHELITLETLRGKVNRDAFEMTFDSKSVPRRRKTI